MSCNEVILLHYILSYRMIFIKFADDYMFDMNRRLEYNKYIKFILLAKQWKRCDAKLKGLKNIDMAASCNYSSIRLVHGPLGMLFFCSKTVPLNFVGK